MEFTFDSTVLSCSADNSKQNTEFHCGKANTVHEIRLPLRADRTHQWMSPVADALLHRCRWGLITKLNAQASVDRKAVVARPDIRCPSAAGGLRGQEQRMFFGLAHIE